MGRASRRRRERKEQEILGVFYNRQGTLLYGVIQFFRPTPGEPSTEPYDQSSPFVIADIIGEDTIVHGSVHNLVRDLGGLLKEVDERLDGLRAEFRHLAPARVTQGERVDVLYAIPDDAPERRTYLEFTRRLARLLILISSQARNLVELFPRLNREIPLYDTNGTETDAIRLVDLFNHFVHNQYLYIDGEHVRDLFPAQPRPRAPIQRTFMGYRLNWITYLETIGSAVHEVKLQDLTGLLRGRLKKLSLKSPYNEIVFLVQNLYSFSSLFGSKVSDGRYRSMLSLLFNEQALEYCSGLPTSDDGGQVKMVVSFNAPHIGIHEDLSEKKFKVHVKCRWEVHGKDGRQLHDEHKRLTIEIGYERLLDHVNGTFGSDALLDFQP